MQGEYKLSDEQSPLAFNDLLCLHLRFDDVWFRALYKCDHLVTFSLRGLAGEAHSRRLCEKAQGAGREGGRVGVFLKRTHASEGCSLFTRRPPPRDCRPPSGQLLPVAIRRTAMTVLNKIHVCRCG